MGRVRDVSWLPRRRALAWICVAAVAGGCRGGSGSEDTAAPTRAPGDGGEDGDGPAEQACDPDGPSPTPLARLSALQYRNSLGELFANAPAAATAIETALIDLPTDEADDHAFSAMDLRVTQRHVTTQYSVADAVGAAALADDDVLAAIAGDCATASQLDDACFESFVREFGARAHRRPLTDEDLDLYLSLPEPDRSAPEAYRDVMFAMLMSPSFNYHFETEGAGDDLMELDGFEIANRLSYHFWQSMPDAALFAAAADGSLETEEGFAAAVDRMVNGEGRERVQTTVQHFYREWLGIEELGAFVDTPAFETFAEGVAADDALVQAMVEEIDALTHYFTFETDGRFADLVASELSFTDNPTLASLYGVPTWDGASTPPSFPEGERAGILTRAAMLFSGDEKTNPIFRGIDVRERLLCLDLGLPDPNALPADAFDPIPLDPELSTRQRYDAKTAAPQCQGCHAQINPIGYVQEAYDALGRFRTVERIIDDSGAVLGEQPVDTVVAIDGLAEDTVSFDGPVAMMQWLAEDSRVQRCFSQQYFQFTFRRDPSPNDACVVENIELTLDEDGLLDALQAIALQPEFRLRRVEG